MIGWLFGDRPAKPQPTPPEHSMIEVDGRLIPVELKRSSASRRLTLRADAARGVVRISLPPRVAASRVRDFIDAHRHWIAARVAAWPAARPFAPNATVPVEGRDRLIDWSPTRSRTLSLTDDRLIAGGPLDGLSGRIERFLKRHALAMLEPETRALALRVGREVTRVSVRETTSRWGSCSGSGAIAYSWRLILMPPEVRASIVAHEVAHLVHLNHSRDFHALADQLHSHHASATRWLKRHGAALHWVGRVNPAPNPLPSGEG